ncbi:MAG: hypothetical protein NPIRA03_10550 [Nitrospirales bacterium]|nr:MAG: hypothetical protein NPIRA03_10550 [Nitrospirales bacterium]
MKLFSSLAIITLAVVFATPMFAEPYPHSCEIVLDRVEAARKALLPFRRTMELLKAHQSGAYGEAEACVTGSRHGGDTSVHCTQSRWHSPKPDTFALVAIDQYRQKRKTFEELFQQARQICLHEP